MSAAKKRKPVKRRWSTVPLPQRPVERNREGRTGLDPMDNYRESGYLQGIILKQIFTGKLRTRNGFFLFIMLGLGLLLSITGHYIYVGTADYNWSMAVLCMLPMVVFGLALLYNFGVNMWIIVQQSPIGKRWTRTQHKPKYRKSRTSK